MDKLVHTWETNEDLTLAQRERYKFLEESYLREKHSKKEKIFNFELKKENCNYILSNGALYKVVSEDTENYYASRCGEKRTFNKTLVKKEEGSKVWKSF